jgi:hypothetical protein
LAKNPLHFYEKVIKVKADVAALHIFFSSDINDAALGGVNFISLFSLAAFRTLVSPWDTPFPHSAARAVSLKLRRRTCAQ